MSYEIWDRMRQQEALERSQHEVFEERERRMMEREEHWEEYVLRREAELRELEDLIE